MQQSVMGICNLIHFADDTVISCSHNDLTAARNNLQQTIERLFESHLFNANFFDSHQSKINANKTDFICFCEPTKNSFARSHTIKVKNQIINTSTTVKCLKHYMLNAIFFQLRHDYYYSIP